MKKLLATAGIVSIAAAGMAFAGGGGKPAAHGLSGSDWGSAVSSAAKDGGLGGHASGKD